MATNAAWLAAFAALSVTGVTRHYDEPPASVSTADLPALFLDGPSGEMPGWTVSCRARNKTRGMRVILLVEPVGQGTNAQNFAAYAALADNLEAALDALAVQNFIEYDLAAGVLAEVAGVAYWAIVCNVRGRDV